MHWYSVYGRCLASELELPLLQPSPKKDADWTFRIGRTAPTPGDPVLIGADRVEGTPVRLVQHASGFRIEYDDTGIFDLSADGREIRWYERAGVDRDLLSMDLTGKVLALALHLWGKLALHASAVMMSDQGVAFLAPKGYGKSTLTMALTAAGARLASDDMLTVDFTSPITAWPGLYSVRLWPRSVDAVSVEDLNLSVGAGNKIVLSGFAEEKLVRRSFPLRALYLLHPVQAIAGSSAAVARDRLDPVTAVMALVTNTKLGPLLGNREAAVVLQRTAMLTRHVPIFRLSVVRDLERLGEVVEQVFGWHVPAGIENPLLEAAS